jgi:hypothetical protein
LPWETSWRCGELEAWQVWDELAVIEDTAVSDLNHTKMAALQPIYEAIMSESVASCSENSRLFDFRNVNFRRSDANHSGSGSQPALFNTASRLFPSF